MAISATLWYGVSLRKGAREMRKILEDFYYGNITPSEQQMTANSELRRAVSAVTRCEQQLTERLGESERTLLTELVKTQHQIDSITAMENFVMGFRLGVRMMAECMDEDGGNIKKIG